MKKIMGISNFRHKFAIHQLFWSHDHYKKLKWFNLAVKEFTNPVSFIYFKDILSIYRSRYFAGYPQISNIFQKTRCSTLLQRFELSLDEVKHYIKTAKIIKPVEKDGNIGILQSNIGNSKIRFVFTIREKALWIITVEESK